MKNVIDYRSLFFWSLTMLSIAMSIIKLGFSTGFLIILIIWALLFYLLFIKKITKSNLLLFGLPLIAFMFTILISYGVIFNFSEIIL